MDTKIDKSRGYVIVWRSLMDTIIFKNEKLWQLYSWCLFRANHRIQEELPGLKKVHLEPGQFITSTRHAADALGVSVTTLYSYLNILEAEHQIERKANNRYSVITILNWNEIQNPERKTERQVDNKKNANPTQIIQGNTLNTQNTEENDNGIVSLEDKTNSSHISSLKTYVEEEELSATEDPIQELKDVGSPFKEAIAYYFDKYCEHTGKYHPWIKQEQLTRVVDTMAGSFDDDVTIMGTELDDEEWEGMINEHFARNLETDWNINHFATRGILLRLWHKNR